MRAIIVLLAALAALAAAANRAFTPSEPLFWIAAGVGVVALVVQALLSNIAVNSARRAQEEFKVTVGDQLAPVARELGIFAALAPSARQAHLGEVFRTAASAATGLVGPAKRARATLYDIEEVEGCPTFVPSCTIGRVDNASTQFRKCDEGEGSAVWRQAEKDLPRFSRDTVKDAKKDAKDAMREAKREAKQARRSTQADPAENAADSPHAFEPRLPFWDSRRPRAYRTFITVGIRAGDQVLGLLSVNSPKPGDLSDADVDTMRVLASLVGSAMAVAKLESEQAGSSSVRPTL